MKRLALILGFVVFWRQWEVYPTIRVNVGDVAEYEPRHVEESMTVATIEEARAFVTRHSKDERYTDMHIFRIGEEVR